MIVTIYFEVDHKKTGFGPKNSIFGPQKGHFGQSGPRNGPPGSQTATYRKTEGIQSYLRIWGTYDPIESGPSDPKKWGLYRRSVKNADFRAKIGPRRPPWGPPCNGVNTKMLSFCCPVMMVTKELDAFGKKMDFGPKNCIFGPKFCIFLRYTYETPIF